MSFASSTFKTNLSQCFMSISFKISIVTLIVHFYLIVSTFVIHCMACFYWTFDTNTFSKQNYLKAKAFYLISQLVKCTVNMKGSFQRIVKCEPWSSRLYWTFDTDWSQSKIDLHCVLFDLSILQVQGLTSKGEMWTFIGQKSVKCCKICTFHQTPSVWHYLAIQGHMYSKPWFVSVLMWLDTFWNWERVFKIYILSVFSLSASVRYNLLVKAMYSMQSKVSLWRVRFDEKGAI